MPLRSWLRRLAPTKTKNTKPSATPRFRPAVESLERRDVMSVVITEVHPSGSGNGTYAADWFEVTNTGQTAVDITGWKVDDSSNAFATALALTGVTSIAAGESVVFLETANLAATKTAFLSAWFGANPPANIQVGSYTGSGVGGPSSRPASR